MIRLSDADWRLIEAAYRSGRETTPEIAERFGVHRTTITARAKKCGWPTRQEIYGDAGDKAGVILRFYRLIEIKLEQMELDMARSEERTAADNERETRALGTLIRNFEKVHGLERELGKDDDKRHGPGPEQHAEAEAIRRELAERLVRLRETEPGDDQ